MVAKCCEVCRVVKESVLNAASISACVVEWLGGFRGLCESLRTQIWGEVVVAEHDEMSTCQQSYERGCAEKECMRSAPMDQSMER